MAASPDVAAETARDGGGSAPTLLPGSTPGVCGTGCSSGGREATLIVTLIVTLNYAAPLSCCPLAGSRVALDWHTNRQFLSWEVRSRDEGPAR